MHRFLRDQRLRQTTRPRSPSTDAVNHLLGDWSTGGVSSMVSPDGT
jgi:hypothetical protein